MELTQEQIIIFCSGISISDIKQYISENKEKYEEFLKNREKTK